jgi:hypothetical protein
MIRLISQCARRPLLDQRGVWDADPERDDRPTTLGVTGCGVVGKAGFEPAISRSRTERDTRLRYFPNGGRRIGSVPNRVLYQAEPTAMGRIARDAGLRTQRQRAQKTTPFIRRRPGLFRSSTSGTARKDSCATLCNTSRERCPQTASDGRSQGEPTPILRGRL